MPTEDRQTVRWIPVLMYHRVVDRVDGPDPYRLEISVADFDAQMRYLTERGYEAIALNDMPRAITAQSLRRKPVAISFDDGYRDTLTHAFPILQKYGLTATVMLVSECVGGSNSWDRGKAKPVPLLSLSEIRALERGGIRFGAHGTTHASLADVSLETARRELFGAKSRLEGMLGCEITTYAYPYGRSTPAIERLAKEAGYQIAFSTDQATNTRFNYSRIDAAGYRGNTLVWRMKVAGVYHSLRQSESLRALNNLRKRARKQPA